jgi:ABC-type nitrate/sulfonate/bicarbonate transport system, permease component
MCGRLKSGGDQYEIICKTFFDKLSPWFLPIGLILIWQISSSLGTLSNQILPSPIDVLKAAITQTQSGVLLENLKISFLRAITGFVIGGTLGLLFGIINGSSKSAQKYLDTTIQMLRNIPNLAMIPLVIIWFGVGEEGKIFLVVN